MLDVQVKQLEQIREDHSYITSLFTPANNYMCIFTKEQNTNIVIVSLADDVHFFVQEEERQRMKTEDKDE